MDYIDKNVQQAEEVVQSFVSINKNITRFTLQNAASLGLTLPQMGILNTISSIPGITLKEITVKLFIPKSTVSVSIEELVKAGLVERKASLDDRREINLKVTTKGRELSKKSCESALSYRVMVSVLEKISDNDIQMLLHIHNEILTQLKENE